MAKSKNRNASSPYLYAAALCAAAAIPTGAQAACMLSIEPSQDQLVIRHNPLESSAVQGQVEVNIVNRGDSECIGTLGSALRGEQFGLRSIGDANAILYQLVDEKGRNDITPLAGRNLQHPGGRAIRLLPGERSLEIVSLAAVPDSNVSQGRYTQSLDLTVLSAEGMPLGSRPLTIGIDIVPAALIGVKGQLARARRGANSIDLGELQPGPKALPLTLYVVSTGGYRVSISSEHQGRLKHESAEWYVDYQLRLGQYDLDLSSPDSFEIISSRARFDNYPVKINIGETAGKRAGGYADTVTFTVAAL